MRIKDLTSNQYWGGLCRRFDKRVRLLLRIGFRYDNDKGGYYNPAYRFKLPAWRMPPSFIMHSDIRAFRWVLADQRR